MEPTQVNRPLCLSDSDFLIRNDGSIDEYIEWIGVPIVDLYEVPSKDSKGKLTHTYVPDVHRAHIKALVDFVISLHRMGISLARFDESNLVVHDNKLEYRGLEFVERLEPEDLRSDYDSVHDIIQNLVKKHNPNNYDCESLDDLLLTLKEGSRWVGRTGDFRWFEGRLKNHPALLSHEKSLQRIKNFADSSSYIKEKEDQIRYNKALRMMGRSKSNMGDWTTRFNSSKLGLGPAKDCFDFVPAGKVKTYQGTNRDILRFGRNLATHLQQHMWKHTTSKYGQKDVDLTIMALFETEYLSFHKLIFELGISSYFIQEQDTASSYAGQDSIRSYGVQRSTEDFTPSPYGTRQSSGALRHLRSS